MRIIGLAVVMCTLAAGLAQAQQIATYDSRGMRVGTIDAASLVNRPVSVPVPNALGLVTVQTANGPIQVLRSSLGAAAPVPQPQTCTALSGMSQSQTYGSNGLGGRCPQGPGAK